MVVVADVDEGVLGVAATVAVVDVGDAAGGSTVNDSALPFLSSPLISLTGVVDPFVVAGVALAAAFAHCVEQYGFFLRRFFGSVLPQCSQRPVSDFSGDARRRFTVNTEKMFVQSFVHSKYTYNRIVMNNSKISAGKSVMALKSTLDWAELIVNVVNFLLAMNLLRLNNWKVVVSVRQ